MRYYIFLLLFSPGLLQAQSSADSTQKAREHFQKAMFLKKFQQQKALHQLTKAIQYDPDYARAYYKRGLLKSNMEKYKSSIPDFTKAITLQPDSFYYYFDRGVSYFYTDQYQKAVTDIDKALRMAPKPMPAYYYYRGQAKAGLNDREGACRDWKKGAELGNTRCKNEYHEQCQ